MNTEARFIPMLNLGDYLNYKFLGNWVLSTIPVTYFYPNDIWRQNKLEPVKTTSGAKTFI
jgi:hypothetical protein